MSVVPSVPAGSHDPLRYRADIDGLRALAVLSVVGFHAFPDWVRGGFVGVDIFFVISGFLISSILFRSLEAGRFSFAAFYSARVRRIFSALIVVLLACFAAGWLLLVADEFKQLGKHIAGGAGFVSNLMLWDEAGYFTDAAETKPLLHLWSLGIEEQFYLAWPLLVYLAWKRHFNWLAGIAIVIAGSFALEIVTARHDAVASFYSPLARFWELMIGGGLAYLAFHQREPFAGYRELKAAAGIVLIGIALWLVNKESAFPGWWALLPTLGAFLLISAGPEAWFNRHVLGQRAVVWIGLISYPLYLWHWPLLAFARIESFGVPSRAVRIGAVAASIVLAWLTYVIVERPIRSRGRGAWKAGALVVAMAGVFALGLYVYASGGFLLRRANADERAQFVHYYDDLHKNGLHAAYREQCDFYDWRAAQKKEAIADECTAAGPRGTELLWGDSHAQALSRGLAATSPEGVSLAQVATAGCKPALEDVDRATPGDACNDSNRFAREAIAHLQPDIVFLAQRDDHLRTDWEEIAAFIHVAGGKRVVLVGPLPQWQPSLPRVIVKDYWGRPHDRVSAGLDPAILALDRALAERYAHSQNLTYVSLVSRLCDAGGCRATVPGVQGHNLMAADYGHLTPMASEYVVREVLLPQL